MAEPIYLPLFPDKTSLTRIQPERNEWRAFTSASEAYGGDCE
jgi:hypothetical protein